jgi:Integrase zinc binding domain
MIPFNEALTQELIRQNYDDLHAGHFGAKRTTELVRPKYYWQKLHANVKDYVATCNAYQRNKFRKYKPHGQLKSLPQLTWPWKNITIYFIVGLPLSQQARAGPAYDSILVIVDQ